MKKIHISLFRKATTYAEGYVPKSMSELLERDKKDAYNQGWNDAMDEAEKKLNEKLNE